MSKWRKEGKCKGVEKERWKERLMGKSFKQLEWCIEDNELRKDWSPNGIRTEVEYKSQGSKGREEEVKE